MKNNKKHAKSFWGEFMDKSLEIEFFNYEMRRYAKFVGPVALIFGLIYMMFFIADYFAIEASFLFMRVLIIRTLFLVVSIVVCLTAKKIKNSTNLAYLITAYELFAIIGFLFILNHYESLTLLSLFSVMAMTLAVYITPNKQTYSIMISAFFILSFLIFHAKSIDGMDLSMFFKITAYILIIIIYCNIGFYLTNFYKRKQFVDSRELLKISITDPLTGIYNRAKFNEELNHWTDYCNRHDSCLSLVIFDIDDFKKINDCYGHLIGDSVIKSVTSKIKMVVRTTDIFARWGGEEFVILFPNTDIHHALEIVELMRSCIQNNTHNKIENITCSFGLAALRKNETGESLLQRADKLLYEAKNCGKNVAIYNA